MDVIGEVVAVCEIIADLFFSEELLLTVFEIGIVKGGKDVADAEPLRNALRLLELLFVERDVVVAGDVLQGLQQVVLQVLLPLFLLNDNRSLEVQVVLLFQNVEKGRVRATIDSDLLKLVPEVVLDRLLLEAVSLEDDIVLAL